MQYLKFWLKVISLLLLWGILLPRLVHAQAGSPDPSFGGGDGFATTPFLNEGHASANTVAIQSNGRIVVAGSTWIPLSDGTSQVALARYMPDGSLDPTFGEGGKAMFSLADWSIYAADMLLLPDGKILCAGSGWNGNQSRWMLARILADGTLDNSFDGDGILITQVGNYSQSADALALQPDGKIVVAGYANFSGYDEIAVLRYKASGILDNSFGGGDGIVTTPFDGGNASGEDVLIQPDGKIVVGGYAKINGFEDFTVVRYKSDGTLDHSFSGDGIAIASFTNQDDRANCIALQPDGKIVLAGVAGSFPGADTEMAIARFTSYGILDASYGNGDGLVKIHVTDNPDYATDIALQTDGKMLVSGHSRHDAPGGSPYHFTLARLTAGGTPDPDFGGGDGFSILSVSPSGDFSHAMALQPDGKAVAVGKATNDNFQKFVVARFLTGSTVASNAPAVFSGITTLYPNPVREQATLEYELASNEEVTVNLQDMQGRFIQSLLPRTSKIAGKHSETILFTQELPSGTYILTIETTSGMAAIEVIF